MSDWAEMLEYAKYVGTQNINSVHDDYTSISAAIHTLEQHSYLSEKCEITRMWHYVNNHLIYHKINVNICFTCVLKQKNHTISLTAGFA